MRIIDILNAPKCKKFFLRFKNLSNNPYLSITMPLSVIVNVRGFVFQIRIFLILFGEPSILVGQKYVY